MGFQLLGFDNLWITFQSLDGAFCDFKHCSRSLVDTIEVFSYFLFFLLRKKSTNFLILLAAGLNVLSILSRVLSGTEESLSENIFAAWNRFNFTSGFNFFLMGWLIARLISKSEKNLTKAWVLLSEASTKLAISGLIWLFTFLVSPGIFGSQLEALGYVAISAVATFLAFGSKPLRVFLVSFGQISYSLFFTHFVIVLIARRAADFIPDQSLSLPTYLTFTAAAYVAILSMGWVLGQISMRFVEKPFMHLARK